MKNLKNDIQQAKCTIAKLRTKMWKILAQKDYKVVDRMYIAGQLRKLREEIWEIISHFERYYHIAIVEVRRVY